MQGSCDVYVYGPTCHKSIVAQWLEYLSGVRKVSGSIPHSVGVMAIVVINKERWLILSSVKKIMRSV